MREVTYRTFWDENGDEITELVEGDDAPPWSLPDNYREREVYLAFENMLLGADRRELPVSRNVIHLAVQRLRLCTYGFGDRFAKDPRPFSSTPLGNRYPSKES